MHWLVQQYSYVECQFNFLVYDKGSNDDKYFLDGIDINAYT